MPLLLHSLAKYADYMRKGYSVAQFMAAELDADAFAHSASDCSL